MSADAELDPRQRGLPRASDARGAPAGLAPRTAPAGKQTLVESSSSGDDGAPDVAAAGALSQRAVKAAGTDMVGLERAIAAIDFDAAVATSCSLRQNLRSARAHVQNELAHDVRAAGELGELERSAEALLAKAPNVGDGALRGSAEVMKQQAETWRARCRGDRPPVKPAGTAHEGDPPYHIASGGMSARVQRDWLRTNPYEHYGELVRAMHLAGAFRWASMERIQRLAGTYSAPKPTAPTRWISRSDSRRSPRWGCRPARRSRSSASAMI